MPRQRRLGWEIWCTWLVLAFLAFVALFYWIAAEQLHRRGYDIPPVGADAFTEEMKDGSVVEQAIHMLYDRLDQVSFTINTYGRINSGMLTLQVLKEDSLLAQKSIATDGLTADIYQNLDFVLDAPVAGLRGQQIMLRIVAQNAGLGSGVALLYNVGNSQGKKFFLGGAECVGQLSVGLSGYEELPYGQLYWPLAAAAVIALVGLCAWTVGLKRRGKDNLILRTMRVIHQYRFLIHQLVSRDFKTKYKRSVLGMLWSLLNPLVTMVVQYLVFSTIFKSDIPYFPVYLLTGILIFSFFTEAVGQGIISIVSNASLITKVYLPKYIYPISKVLSSAINLIISLIPLLVMMAIVGLQPTKALLLIPVGLFFLLLFCMGMALMLSTAMVFFRDTQFLWGIISMAWNYLTPIFYPETIIPKQFLGIYRANPMYQYVAFIRTVIIDGRSPDPLSYLWCALSSLAVLLLGLWLFKKKQDRFVFFL